MSQSAKAFRHDPSFTCIRTHSGVLFNLAKPNPDDVRLRDIAEHTAKINRFTGSTALPLSVAQHCVFVSRLAEAEEPLAAPYGLLHDAEVSYTNDWSKPLRHTLEIFGAGDTAKRIADAIRIAVFRHFGLAWPVPPHLWEIVRQCDAIAYATERRDLTSDAEPLGAPWPSPSRTRIKAWPWTKAADEFITRARELGLDGLDLG